MKDESLFKISASVSLLGIIALLFVFNIKSLEINTNNNIEFAEVDSTIRFNGQVVSNHGNFIRLKNENYVDIFLSEDDINLSKGDNVDIIGSVTDFSGKKTINAERIILIHKR